MRAWVLLLLMAVCLACQAAPRPERKLSLADSLRMEIAQIEQSTGETSSEQYNILREKYKVHSLEATREKLQREESQSSLKFRRVMVGSGVVISLALAAMILICSYYYRKSKQYASTLESTVNKLKREDTRLTALLDELTEQRNKSQASNKLKDDFLHTISHELRTPLNAVTGFSQQIIHKIKGGDPKKLSFFSRQISRNAEQLEEMINNVLMASNIRQYEDNSEPQPVEVHQVLLRCKKKLQERAADGVEIRIVNETPPDFTIVTDDELLTVVLDNLLNNAAKFTSQGWIEVKASTDALTHTKPVFTVTDTGCGIDPDKAPTIFAQFIKLDTFKPGIGLGLYISRCFSRIIGARLTLDKTGSGGSTFSLNFN